MADQPPPQRPAGPRMSAKYTEPISISFASPQQLANFTAGGHAFTVPRMPAPNVTNPLRMNAPAQNTHHAYAAVTTPAHAAATPPVTPPASNPNTLKPLPAQPVDLRRFKGFKFINLDNLHSEQRTVYEMISGSLQWLMCQGQGERCVSELRDNLADHRVFLISSGALGAATVPQIHDLPQLYAVYVYCSDVASHRRWAAKFSKVRVVCNDDDRDLLPLLAVDVAQANIDWADALIASGDKDKAKQKLQAALEKLADFAPNHDPAMDEAIRSRLQRCE